VKEFDPRLVRALRAQMRERDATLRAGAQRVGWKLGMGKRESVAGAIAVGHLTSRTVVSDGGAYSPPPTAPTGVVYSLCFTAPRARRRYFTSGSGLGLLV
jgi:hypothetical protein